MHRQIISICLCWLFYRIYSVLHNHPHCRQRSISESKREFKFGLNFPLFLKIRLLLSYRFHCLSREDTLENSSWARIAFGCIFSIFQYYLSICSKSAAKDTCIFNNTPNNLCWKCAQWKPNLPLWTGLIDSKTSLKHPVVWMLCNLHWLLLDHKLTGLVYLPLFIHFLISQ